MGEKCASVKLNRIVERLVKEVLIDRPTNVVPYLIQFLEQHGKQLSSDEDVLIAHSRTPDGSMSDVDPELMKKLVDFEAEADSFKKIANAESARLKDSKELLQKEVEMLTNRLAE